MPSRQLGEFRLLFVYHLGEKLLVLRRHREGLGRGRIETIKGLPRGRWYALATPRRRSVRGLVGGCLLRSRAPRILRLELPFHRRRRDDDAAQSLPQAERGTPHTAGGVPLLRLLQHPRRSRGGEMRTLRGSAATVSRSEEHTSELQSPM